ncbi:unnamed protein product [Strongylus vulgaris]|uniref:Uncharacterized protein n=1 Tax=Strongylus vulgaris TaxID=40348 RepID=A0A3P7LTS4_STRVU|nr:unnamed protein product [Strongylus vulgaris]
MSAGLGPRYAIYGPLQTVHLNANGKLELSPSLEYQTSTSNFQHLRQS